MSKRKNRRRARGPGQAVRRAEARPPANAEDFIDVPQVLEPRPIAPAPQGRRAVAAQFERYEGLLPHPEHAERFERLLPGTMNRMLTMVEGQSKHRHRMENKFLNFNGWGEIIGVVFAGLTVLGGVAGGVFLLYHDKNAQGLAAILAPLAAVGGIFLRTRSKQTKEIESKGKAVQRR